MTHARIARWSVTATSVSATGRPALRLSFIDDDGVSGWGEAAPLQGRSAESVTLCERVLGEVARVLVGASLEDAAPALALCAETLASCTEQLTAAPSARFATETALLDLLARRRASTIADCLRGSAARSEVAVNALVSAGLSGDELAERGGDARARGYAALKVKLGAGDEGTVEQELARLECLRDRVGPTFPLRIDVGGGWCVDAARRHLRRLAALRPEFVEDPVPPSRLPSLGHADVPWGADEALSEPGLAERLLDDEACAVFVLKPHRLGLLGAFALGREAQRRGRRVTVTHFFDGAIGMAAACEVALALPEPPLASGLAAHDARSARAPQIAHGVRCTRAAQLGLGFEGAPP